MSSKVLLVDDDANNLITLAAILGHADYAIHTATNGIDACRLAAEIAPDLIILDVMMPGMDGFEVCRHIRATPAIHTIPILLLTALDDQAARLEGLNAGADDFLTKPCPFAELRARVATVVRLNRFRAIAEQRTRYEHLFTLAPAAILTLSTTGLIVSANDKARLLFSADQAPEWVGRPLSEYCSASAATVLGQLIAQANAEPVPPSPVNLRFPVAGEERVFKATASLLDERDARLVLLILSDITAEVVAREEAESLSRRLDMLVETRTRQLADANDLLGSYAGFISHDLRSPLAAVQCYLEMIAGDSTAMGSPDIQHFVNRANSACSLMAEMTQSLLQLAADDKNQAGQPVPPVDPKPIIQRLAWKIAAFKPAVSPQFVFGDMPWVTARPALIERVFYNLLINAIKFSATRAQPEIEIGAQTTEDGIALFVRDNGIGFDSSESAQLFKEFTRLPGAHGTEGLGLGLSLVSRLLKAHHGRIWAEGRPDQGATFFVQFSQVPSLSA